MNRDDTYFAAMLARDHRFDGKFFVGVKTTGIYCRPICPAKPKRENIEFYPNSLAAEKAGYRPCLRRRPESAPSSPAWIGKSAIVQRAIRKLNTEDKIELDEDQFAGRFGVTARHLRRLFVDEIGKTPKQLSFENRLNLTRKLIVETSLPLTEIAFAAGFKSIRRFNEAFQARFHKNPSGIRREKILRGSPLRVSVPYRPPFDFDGLMHFYRNHQVGDLERFEDGRMYRLISANGHTGEIAVSNDPERSRLLVEIDFPDTSQIHVILSRVRGLFDLDSDPVVIANALELDPGIDRILKKNPGVRLPSGWDGFEVAVCTILGQLVSVPQGRALVAQLIELCGRDSGRKTSDGRAIRLFPTPKEIAKADLTALRTTRSRKATLRELARRVSDRKLSLEVTQDVEEFRRQLLTIPGIGPWSANSMCMKVLRHTDAFPATDLILARALERHPQEAINQMSPWRAYVAALLWREYAESLQKKRKKKQP